VVAEAAEEAAPDGTIPDTARAAAEAAEAEDEAVEAEWAVPVGRRPRSLRLGVADATVKGEGWIDGEREPSSTDHVPQCPYEG